mmetsp:Transcript_13994/g.42246  ORF Transcript_13994/g.42246 Transcript_13994/m.42246 type:complete len:589 (-) Transcript_13994:1417-3183(-)
MKTGKPSYKAVTLPLVAFLTILMGGAVLLVEKPTLHLGPHIDGFPGLNSASRDSYGEDQLPGRGGRSATNGEGDLIPRSLQQSDRQAAQDSAAGLAESPDTLLFGQPEEMADGTRMFQAASSDNLRQLDKLMSEQPQTLPRQRERSNAREQTGPGKVGRRKGPRRSALLPRLEGPPELAGTIFVSISSYRDPECAYTVQHMFDMADVPERLFAGVGEQLWYEHQESCRTGHLPISLRSNVRYITVNASDAQGPPYGRVLGQQLYRGEDYYMQIDSHTQFAPGWDRRMIEMHVKLERCVPKPVISHYPASVEDLNDMEVPRICNATYLEDVGVWRLWEAENQLPVGQFVPTPFAAGGFMFFKGSCNTEVPFDPHIPYLFDGEEILFSVRLYTHGYDVFTPIENLVFHHYERAKAKSVYSDHNETWFELEARSINKVRYMLKLTDEKPDQEMLNSLKVYGLGTARSVDDYYKFSNMDPTRNVSRAADKFCGETNGLPPNACLANISRPLNADFLKDLNGGENSSLSEEEMSEAVAAEAAEPKDPEQARLEANDRVASVSDGIAAAASFARGAELQRQQKLVGRGSSLERS